jgi:molybdenum cofactor biosynthesis protein B
MSQVYNMATTPQCARPLSMAVLTVSDSRTLNEDSSGQLLEDRLRARGHACADRQLVPDDIYRIRAAVSAWIADDSTQVILITGGTGFSDRDSTPEAVSVLLDKTVDGFGELFRALSLEEIGTSTLQSRCLAGIANATLVVCMPGSTNACRLAWDRILDQQLDAEHKPCNFVAHLKRNDNSCQSRG